MAIAYDAFSKVGTAAAGNISWTHTPSGTPKGVIVWIVTQVTTTDEVTTVTYGGVSMNQVAASPTSGGAGTDASVVHCFFLGSSIPTGAQTVAVTTNASAGNNRGYCVTVTAAANTEVVDSDGFYNSIDDPSGTLTLGGATAFCALGFFSGRGTVDDVAPLTSWTSRDETIYGAQISGCYTYDTIGSSDVTYGYTATGTDEANLQAIAVKESAAAGNTVSPGVGVLTLTGNAPTIAVTAHQTVRPGSGALTLSGFAPVITVSANQTVSPDAGALTLTGFAPTISVAAGQTVQPAKADLTLTGFAPTITVTTNNYVIAGKADLTLTGFAPTVTVPDHKTVSPDAGVLTLTGFAPTVTVAASHTVEPNKADLTLTGFAPAVTVTTNHWVIPGAATLELTGYAPTVTGGESAAIPTGAGRSKKYQKRRKKRWVLPNGMHVYGTEEEAVALAEQLTGKPAVIVEKKPKKPIVLTLDDGASVETAPIYPVYRKKEAPENFIGMTQTADAVLIRAEIISNLLEEQKRKRRRKMAAMLLL